MATRRGTAARRSLARTLARGAVVAVAAATIATVATTTAFGAGSITPLGFGPPATGSNGSYSLSVPFTGSVALPPVTGGVSGGTVAFALTGSNTAGCAVASTGGTVTVASTGKCDVVATLTVASTESGDTNRECDGDADSDDSGCSASLAITVALATQTISVTPQTGPVGSSLALVASGYTGSGAITFALAGGGTAGGCALSAATVTATSAGACLVTASIAADSGHQGATSAPAAMTFTRKPQSIAVAAASGTVGTPVTLVATGYLGTGAITFDLVSGGTAAGCALSSGHLSVTGPGTCDVTASIAADPVYVAATSPTASISFRSPTRGTIVVTASSETINAGSPIGETASVTGLQSGDSGHVTSVTFTYTGTTVSYGPTTTPPTDPGTYSVTPSHAIVSISPSADASRYGSVIYDGGTLVIKGGKLTVTASSGSITAGDPFSPSATVSDLATGDTGTVASATYTYTGIGSTSYGPSGAVPKGVGAYDVTPSAATVTISPSSDQSFYPPPFTYVAGTLIVAPKPVVVPVNAPKAPARTVTVSPFPEGSYALGAKLKRQVMVMAEAIKSAGYKTVSLTGYTDNVFTPAFNALLELNRAKAVSLQLSVDLTGLHVHGVVITVVPAPSIVLVATNTTAKGRAANRRVVATLPVQLSPVGRRRVATASARGPRRARALALVVLAVATAPLALSARRARPRARHPGPSTSPT